MAAAREWLFGTLTADATLVAMLRGGAASGINNQQAEQGTPYPLVIYQFMSGIDYAAVGAFRIWTNMIWLVKAVGDLADDDFDPATLDAIMARIDTLLHRASGTPASGVVWSCTRESTIEYPEDVSGRPFKHTGATYRLYAS